jgi:hypothetical protein
MRHHHLSIPAASLALLLGACGQNSNPLGDSGDYSESGSASSPGFSGSYEPSVEPIYQEPVAGEAPGGEATGGEATGGEATGGEATGAEATGGKATGGEATGGEAADAGAPAEAAQPVDAAPEVANGKPLLFSTDMEDQDAGCWSDRNGSGYTRAGCGGFNAIGSSGAVLSEGGPSHSGAKSMKVTFGKNEDVAGAGLTVNADVVNVRAWYNFSEGFDFGQGVKIARVSSFNESTQGNDIDMVMTVRSPQSSAQCGLTDMADMGFFFNGRPVGHDWGNVTAPVRFERGRWYAIEYQVKLNSPGARDGSVKIWVDGQLVGTKEGLNIRGKAGSNVKLNRIRVGGWYSNGANGNSCRNPSGPSTVHIDDLAVGEDYIGI